MDKSELLLRLNYATIWNLQNEIMQDLHILWKIVAPEFSENSHGSKTLVLLR